MFRNIILFFVTMISCTCSYAQEDVTVTISMNKWKAMEESVKHLNDSITSLNKIIVSKDTLISNREKINEQTLKKLQAVNSECTKLNVVINKMKSDSIDSSKMLGDLRSQLLSAQKQLGRVDTMTIQVIITYMNLKCSESKIIIICLFGRQNRFRKSMNSVCCQNPIDIRFCLFQIDYKQIASSRTTVRIIIN